MTNKTCRCRIGSVKDKDGLYPVICSTHGNIGGSVNKLLSHLLARTHTQVSRTARKKAESKAKDEKRNKKKK